MQTTEDQFTPDENGNHTSPALSALIGVWDDYDGGQTDEKEVRTVISRVEAFVREKISEMENDGESSDVDVLDPNRVAILGAFQDHLTGLKIMLEGLNGEDYDSVDHSFEILQSATNRMVEGLAGLVEDQDRYLKIRCVRCSTENEKGTAYCSQCGAILPKVEQETQSRVIAVAGESSQQDEETTPNYIEVAEAHQGWLAEEISAEQFYQTLLQVHGRQAGQHEEMDKELQTLTEEGGQAEREEHLRQFLTVLEEGAQALDTMLQALEDGNTEQVEAGLNSFAEATIKIVELDKASDAFGEESEAGEGF